MQGWLWVLVLLLLHSASNAQLQQAVPQAAAQRVYDCSQGGNVAVNSSGLLVPVQKGQPAGGLVCWYKIGGGPGTRATVNFTLIDGDPGLTWAGAPPCITVKMVYGVPQQHTRTSAHAQHSIVALALQTSV